MPSAPRGGAARFSGVELGPLQRRLRRTDVQREFKPESALPAGALLEQRQEAEGHVGVGRDTKGVSEAFLAFEAVLHFLQYGGEL